MDSTAAKQALENSAANATERCDPSARPAHLLVNFSMPRCIEAIKVLRDAGFQVFAAPITGILEPRLLLGTRSYFGLDEIRELVESVRR